MTNYCSNDCIYLDKEYQICKKFKSMLPCNIDLKIFKCKECLEESNESKDKT